MSVDVLRDIEADGYPTDYLVARVRGRRARLRATEGPGHARQPVGPASDEAIWGALLDEFDWLRRQMNPGLRRTFAPVFALFAIKTLVLAVRNKAAERHSAVEHLLGHELFGEELRAALVGAPDAPAAVAATAAALAPTLGDSRGLVAAYAEGGLKAFESRLTRDFLTRVATSRQHPVIRRFFTAFIDLRNVMTLYKHLRWGFHDARAFLSGGGLAVEQFLEASSRGDRACLDACVRELAGTGVVVSASDEVALESLLLSQLTRRQHEAGRKGNDCALILDYLWSVYVQARNRALRLHAGDVDENVLARELIA